MTTKRSHRAPACALAVICISVAVYAVLFLRAITSGNPDLLHALTIAPILVALTLPIAFRIARTDRDPTLVSIVMAAVALKLVAAYLRYYVSFEVYTRSDARAYHEEGAKLVPDLRQFVFTDDIGRLVGNGFLRLLTGTVYAIFGTSITGGFFVFAWLGFLGLLLLARAFQIGIPGGDSRRYLIAVLFFPTLLYWPSAIGKEAWMMLSIGLCAYGVACIFQKRSTGVVVLGVGLVAMLLLRPHMTLIVFTAILFAVLVRRVPARTYAAPMLRLLGFGAMAALGLFLLSQSSSFLDQKLGGDGLSVSAQLEQTATRTSDDEAGSSFTPVRVNTPIDIGPAFVTVYFRPFPFEVSNAQGLATAAEGMLLIGVLFASRRRLRSIPRLIRATPYLAFSLGYLLAFAFAFSSFGNFGILARQRVQALPFLLVFIALPRFKDLDANGETIAAETPPEPALTEPTGSTGRRRSRRPPRAPLRHGPVSSGSSFPPPVRSRA